MNRIYKFPHLVCIFALYHSLVGHRIEHAHIFYAYVSVAVYISEYIGCRLLQNGLEGCSVEIVLEPFSHKRIDHLAYGSNFEPPARSGRCGDIFTGSDCMYGTPVYGGVAVFHTVVVRIPVIPSAHFIEIDGIGLQLFRMGIELSDLIQFSSP